MNAPNILSLMRLFSVPVAVWFLLSERYDVTFWLFGAAAITDAIDGFLAKRFNMETQLGKVIDPLADKSLLVGAYVTLGFLGQLPDWLVIMVVFRDLIIVGGYMLLHLLDVAPGIRPLAISKINTTAQIVLVVAVLLELGFGLVQPGLREVLVWVAAATTLASGTAYVVEWARDFNDQASGGTPPDRG